VKHNMQFGDVYGCYKQQIFVPRSYPQIPSYLYKKKKMPIPGIF
jgi:hypothetical protein